MLINKRKKLTNDEALSSLMLYLSTSYHSYVAHPVYYSRYRAVFWAAMASIFQYIIDKGNVRLFLAYLRSEQGKGRYNKSMLAEIEHIVLSYRKTLDKMIGDRA